MIGRYATTMLGLSFCFSLLAFAESENATGEVFHYTQLEIGSTQPEMAQIDMERFEEGDGYTGEPFTGLIISDEAVIRDFPKGTEVKAGNAVECKGFSRKCYVFFDLFNIALSNDFSFERTSKWEWGGFTYIASIQRKVSILGKPIQAVEVFGQQLGSEPLFVTFLIAPELGVVYLRLYGEDFFYSYVLGSEKGLWANSFNSGAF